MASYFNPEQSRFPLAIPRPTPNLSQFGEVLATAEEHESIIAAAIDYSTMDTRRMSLPLAKQRHGDLYQLVDLQRLNLQDAN